MRQIFLDCTHTHRESVTGISRVITNIVKHREIVREFGDYKLVCFVHKSGKLYELNPDEIIRATQTKRSWIYNLRRNTANKLFKFFSRKNLGFLNQLLTTIIATKWADLIFKKDYEYSDHKEVVINPGLDLLLLGEFPVLEAQGLIETAALNKLKIASIVYDLIPITHPMFSRDSIMSFTMAVHALLSASVVNIAISEATLHSLECYLVFLKASGVPLPSSKSFSFKLGSDFTLDRTSRTTSRFDPIFSTGVPTFLVCGTIEPRKNHLRVVKAFEEIWAKDGNANLLIIGREGWNIEVFLSYIEGHKELGKRLFVFHDVDDGELAFAYRNSQALIFASMAEGFGLPLVEAAHYGIPILCSDIPVFHEVAGECAIYFNPYDVSDIGAKVESFLSGGLKLKSAKPVVTSWEESVRQLFSIITREINALEN